MAGSNEIEQRLKLAKKGIRRGIKVYVEVMRVIAPELSLRPGDDRWGAVEITDTEHVLTRIFPKSGKIKVDSLDPDLQPEAFGANVTLTKNREWALDLDSSDDIAAIIECSLHMSRFLGRTRVTVA